MNRMIQITLRKAYNMGFKHEFSIAIITVTPFINVFIGVCVGGCCIKLTKINEIGSSSDEFSNWWLALQRHRLFVIGKTYFLT